MIVSFSVFFRNVSNHVTRGTECNNIGRNILGDQAASTDDSIIANGNPGHHRDIGAKPTIAPHMNRLIILIALFAQSWINRMSRSYQRHVWPEHGAITHVNMGIIHQGQIKISIDTTAKMNMRPTKV